MIRIVFFGTPDIGLKSLEYLYNSSKIEVCAVVTQPDKPSGRGHKIQMPPVKIFAIEHNIPVFQPKSIRKEPEIINALKEFNPDFFVTFAFGQILSQEVLDIPKYETINLHASLLPKYRGANPIQRAIINGDKETGICTMITELGLDCGDICQRLVIPISDSMNCEQLWDEIAQKSPKMIEDTLIGLQSGEIKPVKQCDNGICTANKLTKEECEIDWTKSNIEIHNLVRGVCRCPSAYFTFNGKLIKVIESKTAQGHADCGTIAKTDKTGVYIGCGEGLLQLITVKPEGKGEMSAAAWYNGVRK